MWKARLSSPRPTGRNGCYEIKFCIKLKLLQNLGLHFIKIRNSANQNKDIFKLRFISAMDTLRNSLPSFSSSRVALRALAAALLPSPALASSACRTARTSLIFAIVSFTQVSQVFIIILSNPPHRFIYVTHSLNPSPRGEGLTFAPRGSERGVSHLRNLNPLQNFSNLFFHHYLTENFSYFRKSFQ